MANGDDHSPRCLPEKTVRALSSVSAAFFTNTKYEKPVGHKLRLRSQAVPTQPTPRIYRQAKFESPAGSTEVFLVRHGESEPAVEGSDFALADGHGDPSLAPEGRDQAKRVGERLATERIDAVYVSSLRRTAETAEPLARRLGLAPVTDPDLREVYLGEWEGGLLRQKVADRDPIAVQMFTEQRWDVIPKAERGELFSRSVRGAMERIATAHRDQRVVVFSHGGTIGEILAQATGSQPFAFMGADNASISHIVITPERWIVRRFNDTAHLEVGMTSRPTPLQRPKKN